ncbi:hypothetical protein CMV_022522 [Castanea mollissima]|uniref:Reverse transcriptase zinc-binding domain n=1 Tax=Castanea mollissima TaxID=60419 RepID=A0A8J4QS85_9ROSI|nr:hypothetical protein CMV_022522 [Castanea mollissima]
MLSLVYGPPYSSLKANFWKNLETTINSFGGVWVGIGDFNCILSQLKKQGGRPFASSSDGGFFGFITNNGLIDLGFQGRHLVSDCFINYYKNLFTSQHTQPSHHIDLSDIIPHSISSEENEALCAIPSDDEIKFVAFSFASSKSPGLDVQSCLSQFQTWSGLSINKRKLTITFSRNVPPSSKISLRNLIGLNQPTSKNFYLGLPTHIQRGHQAQFNIILEKINNRISGWKERHSQKHPFDKKSYCYLIGSSSSVNIWHDPWIPSIPSFTLTPITLLPDQKLVYELIFPETRQWNRALLHNLFDHDTTSSIQQIYIPFTLAADSIIWAKCPSGKFFVKSAYLADQNARFTISGPLTAVEWKKLWSMKFNERLKYHIWKIAWDVLPTREFLARRIVGLDSSCPRCHHPQESVVHILFECPFAIIVWRHTSIPINLSSIPPKSTSDWVKSFLNPVSLLSLYPSVAPSFSLLAAIMCDCIWWSRNKLIFEDLSNPPNQLAADINKFFNSHSEAWLSISPSTASQWCPPPTGWIKFNFDAAIRPNVTFISVVGSDPNGMIISICTAKEPPQSPIWGEAKAALLAMSTAVNLGYKFVIFEGNAKVVIESIVCSSSDPPWEISSIISDIHNLFSYFSISKFSFCYRSCNELARHLARWACISPNWGPQSISSIPPWVFCKKIDGSVPPFLSLPF